MKRHLLVALAAVFVVGMAASAANAQCSFQHPKKAQKLQSNLVQAFVSCGNPGPHPASNTTTEGGVPSCQPVETVSAANPPHDTTGGWKWDSLKAQGKLEFKAKSHCAGQESLGSFPKCLDSSPLNTGPPPSADLSVKLTLKGILAGPGVGTPAGGNGKLATVARATLNDRAGGGSDMTVVDFPAGFPFTLSGGAASMKTSADALLNNGGLSQPGLPPCTSIELVTVRVIDSKGDTFAVMGTYLPQP